MWLVVNSVGLGVGLAMDAAAVALADGLQDPQLSGRKRFGIACLFGFFQALMPLLGWGGVHFLAERWAVVTTIVPYVALILLLIIGGKMLWESRHAVAEISDLPHSPLTMAVLCGQAVSTSLDALSAGFSLAHYLWWETLLAAGIIAIVTIIIALVTLCLGEKCGSKMGRRATMVGGIILILIGVEIFITGVFF